MLSIQNQTPSNAVTHLTYHVIEGLHFISYVVALLDLDIIIWNMLYTFMGYCPNTHNILIFRLIEYKI